VPSLTLPLPIEGPLRLEQSRERPTDSKRRGKEQSGEGSSQNHVGVAGSPQDDLCVGEEERSTTLDERNGALGSVVYFSSWIVQYLD
jgi:hypothetical protein